MMQKRWFLIVVVLLISLGGMAQQFGQYSQYMQNMYVLNPAVAGINHEVDFTLSYRNQWTGINDSPKIFYLTGSAPLAKKEKKPDYQSSSTRISRPSLYKTEQSNRKVYHGIGGMVATQSIGAFDKTLANLSYAVHVPISQSFTLGFGTAAGVSNNSFDQAKFETGTENDQAYINFISGATSLTVLDINMGMMGYTDKWYIGYSVAQLLENELAFGAMASEDPNKLEMHHFIITGTHIPLDAKYTLTPNLLVKYMLPAPVSFDLNAKMTYQDKLWGGLSYRYNSAFVVMFGAKLNNMFRVGYSFDYSLTRLRQFTSGSHEIFLGLILNKKQDKVQF